MDQVPTLAGTLVFSKEKHVWVFDGQWEMGQIDVAKAPTFHFTHTNNIDSDDQRDGT